MIFVRYSFLPHFGILADLKWGLKGYVEGGGQDNGGDTKIMFNSKLPADSVGI